MNYDNFYLYIYISLECYMQNLWKLKLQNFSREWLENNNQRATALWMNHLLREGTGSRDF